MEAKVLAIFGGTFNPPHYGHLKPLQECAEKLAIKHIALMPSSKPALKHLTTDKQHRFSMVKLLAKEDSRFSVENIEYDREETSYTIDTLKLLHQKHKSIKIIFFMGLDALQGLPKWKKWQELFDYCHIVVMARNKPFSKTNKLASNLYDFYTNKNQFDSLVGSEMDEKSRLTLLSKIAQVESVTDGVNPARFMDIISTSTEGKLWFINTQLLPISSTEIRELIIQGKDVSEFLPHSILQYITTHKLYTVT